MKPFSWFSVKWVESPAPSKNFPSSHLQKHLRCSDSLCLTRLCVVTGEGLLVPGRGLGAAWELSCSFRHPHSTTEHRKNWRARARGQCHVENQTEDVHSVPGTVSERCSAGGWSEARLDACSKAAARSREKQLKCFLWTAIFSVDSLGMKFSPSYY